MKSKFFLQISDHQQSVARPRRGFFLIPLCWWSLIDTGLSVKDFSKRNCLIDNSYLFN